MNKNQNEHGFTLIEMAIVLIISGFILSMIMFAYKTYTRVETLDRTVNALNRSIGAIGNFETDYEGYPCPADPTLSPDEANYGIADCDLANNNIIELNGRDTDGDGNPDIVLKGAVPFRTLLDPNGDGDESDAVSDLFYAFHAHDSWNNKLSYFMTYRQRFEDVDNDGFNDAPFNAEDRGAIDVVDEGLYLNGATEEERRQEASLLEEWGTASYAVVSHGPNGVGAFNIEGNEVANCNLGLTTDEQDAKALEFPIQSPPDETENCEDTDGDDAILLSGIKSESRTVYNDDIVRFSANKNQTNWSLINNYRLENGTFVKQITNTNGGNVGVGTLNPEEKLEVDGDIKAFGIHADELCDPDGRNCLNPQAIAGELSTMRCNNEKEVVVSIHNNTVTCASPFTPQSFTRCENPEEVLFGISTSGPLCKKP